MEIKNDQPKIFTLENNEGTENNKYYPLVLEVKDMIEKRFPYGAIHRQDVYEAQKISVDEAEKYLNAFRIFSKERNDIRRRRVDTVANILQPLVYGDYGIYIDYAIGFLKKKYPKLKIDAVYLELHQMLMFGREANSDPKKSSTWGKEALLYDIWAGQVYLACNFLKQREKKAHIPYISAGSGQIRIFQDPHYLDGDLETFEGKSNELHNEFLMNLVEEDQKRLNLPDLKAPSEFLPKNKSNFDGSKIKEMLSELSKCDGWKYNSTANTAWIECDNEMQGQRISAALKNTKAVVVSLNKRKDNNKYVVKCEHFDFEKLKALSDSLKIEYQPISQTKIFSFEI